MRPRTGRTPAVCLLLWACAGWGQSPPPGEAPAAQHVARAEELANKGDLEAAARELQRAIELDPNSATTRVALGEVLEAEGKSEESIREYRQAIQIQPKLAEAHNQLGNALVGIDLNIPTKGPFVGVEVVGNTGKGHSRRHLFVPRKG